MYLLASYKKELYALEKKERKKSKRRNKQTNKQKHLKNDRKYQQT